MNKLILCFSVGVCVVACACPCEAQTASTAPVVKANSKSKQKQIEVKDYNSFRAHVTNEESKRANPIVTNETGAVRRVLKEKGLEISSSSLWAQNSDRSKIAYQAPNGIGVSVNDYQSHRVEIYNANGERLREIAFPKSINGKVAFSDSRLVIIQEGFGADFGFEIYDNSGKLVKQLVAEDVDGYAISYAQKLFAVTAGRPKTGDYFVLYDMDGNEVWRYKTVVGAEAKISFSPEDRYALVKMPKYWEKAATVTNSRSKFKRNKYYLFDVVLQKLISEGNYAK